MASNDGAKVGDLGCQSSNCLSDNDKYPEIEGKATTIVQVEI
jgi:hypothetical protein